eukprot:jgi/Botrbrau1/9172/Bobra.0236s0004.1
MYEVGSRAAVQLRRLVIDLEEPSPPPEPEPVDLEQQPYLRHLNPEQLLAVQRMVGARDYTLVQGMPGSGKSSTVAAGVRALLARGRSVLLTSYTNSAVDNIALKLAGEGVPLLRIGRAESVHPDVRPHLLGGPRFPAPSLLALQQLVQKAPVVACTCLGVATAVLVGRTFDVCIMDEAGQMTLPVALGPLLRARAFCLLGDHFQLAPLVQSPQAQAGGLSSSLFRILCEAHPQALVRLCSQYRMADDIMELANELVYEGQMRSASEEVALRSLILPNPLPDLPHWLHEAISPARRALLLDTDPAEGGETRVGDALRNPLEAELVMAVVAALLGSGLPASSVGITSPYRSQVCLMQQQAAARGWAGLEILTMDKYQGRDKEVMLLSLVRSNAGRQAGSLLADWRRINVAITRAKAKLVLLGSASTLASVPLLARLINILRRRGCVLPLSPCDDLIF